MIQNSPSGELFLTPTGRANLLPGATLAIRTHDHVGIVSASGFGMRLGFPQEQEAGLGGLAYNGVLKSSWKIRIIEKQCMDFKNRYATMNLPFYSIFAQTF